MEGRMDSGKIDRWMDSFMIDVINNDDVWIYKQMNIQIERGIEV